MQANYSVAYVVLMALAMGTACFSPSNQEKLKNPQTGRVNVWDTYVTRKDGRIMHFDIIVPTEIQDTAIIYKYGREYLKSKGEGGQPLTSKQCRLCHSESINEKWEASIREKGYDIIEMEGCD
jgi:hypothetical protein